MWSGQVDGSALLLLCILIDRFETHPQVRPRAHRDAVGIGDTTALALALAASSLPRLRLRLSLREAAAQGLLQHGGQLGSKGAHVPAAPRLPEPAIVVVVTVDYIWGKRVGV